MFKRIVTSTLLVGAVMSIVPAIASAEEFHRDRDRYEDRIRDRREFREHFRDYGNRDTYFRGYYDRFGYWHRY